MVYILIATHNNKQDTLAILNCLSKQSFSGIKTILIDDGSTDNTEAGVKAGFPDTVILKGNGNLWWTGANVVGVNYALEEAQADDYILLLNNDLLVEDDYVELLFNASATHGRAIVGSALVDHDQPDFIESGIKLDQRLILSVNRNGEIIRNTEFDMDVDVLPGRGTLIPIEVFKSIGNFNREKLPHYGADYEFSIRAKRAGYKLMVSNRARVVAKLHITGMESPAEKIISHKKCFTLLFSKKSKLNIIYGLNYVWLCSERKFRMHNMLNRAKGILKETACKTIFIYVPYIIIKAVLSIVGLLIKILNFLFNKYPLRADDIKKHGLCLEELIKQGILYEVPYRGEKYYRIDKDIDKAIKNLSPAEAAKLAKLKRLSLSYSHKKAVVSEKINIIRGTIRR